MKAARLQVIGTVAGLIGVWAMTAGGCANEQQKRGQELYAHYCMHCHGESGRQNEGFNWSAMPDPKPKDLSNKSEMSTFKDEDIFNTISRDMKDTSEGGDKIGDDEFAVPTMPTFKYTLSEDEIWAIVGHVRTLHGMKLEFKVEERKKELAEGLKAAQEKFDASKQAYEAAEKKASEDAEKKSAETKKDVDVDESAVVAPHQRGGDERGREREQAQHENEEHAAARRLRVAEVGPDGEQNEDERDDAERGQTERVDRPRVRRARREEVVAHRVHFTGAPGAAEEVREGQRS